MPVVKIPQNINADGLLPLLSLLGSVQSLKGVELDFSELRRVTPAALVGLASHICKWKKAGVKVTVSGTDSCSIFGYLLRMDLFSACGLDQLDTVTRDAAVGKFVPVRPLIVDTDALGSEISSCIAPGGEDFDHPLAPVWDVANYVITETANNVRQHSRGEGFVAAQVTGKDGLVRMALADNGRGILKSFQDAGFPWSQDMSDIDAISKALEPRITSSFSEINAGVGLTLVRGLAHSMRAWMLIVSGKGVFTSAPNGRITRKTLPYEGYYQGTLIGLTFDQDPARNFSELLHKVKLEAGLLRDNQIGIKFTA